MSLLEDLNYRPKRGLLERFVLCRIHNPKNEPSFYDKLNELDIMKGYTNSDVKYFPKGYYLEIWAEDLEKFKKHHSVLEIIERYDRRCFKNSNLETTHHIQPNGVENEGNN
jgi:hypothetical protein